MTDCGTSVSGSPDLSRRLEGCADNVTEDDSEFTIDAAGVKTDGF